MKVADYNNYVLETDQYKLRSREDRRNIAIYGLVGEIGSLVSAVKKKLLAEDKDENWDLPNDEITEELGDVIWYCFSLAQIANSAPVNILTNDIAILKKEIGSDDERATRIKDVLDPTTREKFLAAAANFPRTQNMSFDDYQTLSFLTARTSGKILLEVCLALIWQLGAELLRGTLPKIEITLNKNVADRPTNIILGEIAWHLAAIASLYKLSLNEVVERNVKKLNFRKQTAFTALHDSDFPPKQQFPRLFRVQFASVGPAKLRMYLDGKRLGNDLTDNAHDDDGYRFHDILHLSLVAHLGWSPVMRALMNRKRRRDPKVDEVEDGARAQIVEELVIKAIHSEGDRLANEAGRCPTDGPSRFFPSRSQISFRFLKMIHGFVKDLEVEANTYWEWDNAILEGAEIFYHLRKEEQGTVTVDLTKRKLTFDADVCLGLQGVAVGIGMGVATASDLARVAKMLAERELVQCRGDEDKVNLISAKRAILASMNLSSNDAANYSCIEIKLMPEGQLCLKVSGDVQRKMRDGAILDFRPAFVTANSTTTCTVLAIADPGDMQK